MAERDVDTLILGAGPFGLALAAYVDHLGLDYLLVGEPMAFWTAHMPAGMYLRSASDWHLDPLGQDTIEAYTAERGMTAPDVEPLARDFYLGYAAWFQRRKQIEPLPDLVSRLDRIDDRFLATLVTGEAIAARAVVLAVGFGSFRHVPAEVAALLPPESYGHSRDEVAFAGLNGQRCLIVGGRQSAYEWAALLHEAGVAEVHIVHRHPVPAFAASDWSWVAPLVDHTVDDPGWYRRLPQAEKDAIDQRLYAEGRLKLEPWLQSRIEQEGITVWANERIVACERTPDGHLRVILSGGAELTVDRIILATGYKVELDRLPLLANGNILPHLTLRNGYPVLDEHFQSSVPGLFITSMPAAQDFGPFFAFTVAARMSARVIGDELARLCAQ